GNPLPPGPHPDRRTRYAPTPGPLSPGLGHAVCRDWPAGVGPPCAGDGHRAVPFYGDDLLAAANGGGPGAGGGGLMDFYEVLDKVQELLAQRGRVSYRALKIQFHLDDEALEALKEELIEVHHRAVDQDGRMLVWTGEARPTPGASSPPSP